MRHRFFTAPLPVRYSGLASGIDIPGFKGQLPDGVFVRSISAGTLEQITFRLGLLHALRESGVEVHAVTRSPTHVTHDGEVRWHKANLLDHRDRTQLLDAAAPQTLIHCAWVTEHGAYWTSPENLDWVGATLSLAREAHDRGTSRFVGVGTCAEYEWGGAAPLSEASTPLRPQTLYGVAKNATRSVLEAFSRRGLSHRP